MILGIFDLTTFTWIHTAISLVALAAGIVVVIGLLRAQALPEWTAFFLVTAVATSVTGFGFPFTKLLPSHWVGIISLVVLAGAIVARYVFHVAGAWRWIYVVGIVAAEYFLAFVTIAQAFLKIPALTRMAPTMSEAPFAAAQLVALVLFVGIAVAAVRACRPGAAARP